MNEPKDQTEAACGGSALTADLDRAFTIAEIKAAFWNEFHEAGELWFPYRSMGASEQECAQATEEHWQTFVEALTRSNASGKPTTEAAKPL